MTGQPPDGGVELDERVFRELVQDLDIPSGDGPGTPLAVAVRGELDELVGRLGEGGIGGPSDPGHDLWRHTTRALDDQASERCRHLDRTLREWFGRLGPPQRTYLLLYLWWESWQLWDRSLAYRSLRVVAKAVAQVVGVAVPGDAGASQDRAVPPEDGERAAWQAVGAAMELMTRDGDVFKQTNLSSAKGLAAAAKQGIETAARVRVLIGSALAAPRPASGLPVPLARDALRSIGTTASRIEIFYSVLQDVAQTLAGFDDWLAAIAAQPGRPRTAGSGPLTAAGQALLGRVDSSLKHLRRAQAGLGGSTLSECEPWEQLLTELRDRVACLAGGDSDDESIAAGVFVPQRAWIRYCYPFALEDCNLRGDELFSSQPPGQGDRRSLQGDLPLRRRLQEEFDDALGLDAADRHWMTVGEPAELAQTEFFQAAGSEGGLYGGVRVDLSDLEFTGERWSGAVTGGQRCKVWLDLNRLGNFCLCIELADPLEKPPPDLLYRAIRAGTPFVVGAGVALAAPLSGPAADGLVPSWDNLDAFARDVIRFTADAYCWKQKKEKDDKEARKAGIAATCVRGNVHDVVIVQTDVGRMVQPEKISDHLDGMLGGRILLRSVQRSLSTLGEWIRFPPMRRATSRSGGAAFVALPEIGFSGDWFVHTGGATVFGIVAVPEWLRDVYPEAAQFASSWSPLLRLWSKRLRQAIDDSQPESTQENRSEDLRRVDRLVRQHLLQINSQELCATLAFRRFLDELLETVGVGRLQEELESQLKAAEQLTDWNEDRQRRKSELIQRRHEQDQQRSARQRDIFLFIIALLGIFSLADFMDLANLTRLHEKFLFVNLTDGGRWQDWFILALFLTALAVGFFVLEGHKWLRRRYGDMRDRFKIRKRDRPARSEPGR